MTALIKTDQLYEWFGCKQKGKLMRLMREKNIPYHLDAYGYPITTDAAINDSLKNKQTDDEQVDF